MDYEKRLLDAFRLIPTHKQKEVLEHFEYMVNHRDYNNHKEENFIRDIFNFVEKAFKKK